MVYGALAPSAPSDEGKALLGEERCRRKATERREDAVSEADWGRDNIGGLPPVLSLRHLLRKCHLPRQREARGGVRRPSTYEAVR